MALINTAETELRDVFGLSQQEKQRIEDFLQGGVYCWCKNRKHEWFSMRELMGGDNYHWQGTPLLALYEKHISKGKDWELAVKDAGKDSGWLLKKVISEDKRLFETKTEDFIRKYRWISGED